MERHLWFTVWFNWFFILIDTFYRCNFLNITWIRFHVSVESRNIFKLQKKIIIFAWIYKIICKPVFRDQCKFHEASVVTDSSVMSSTHSTKDILLVVRVSAMEPRVMIDISLLFDTLIRLPVITSCQWLATVKICLIHHWMTLKFTFLCELIFISFF